MSKIEIERHESIRLTMLKIGDFFRFSLTSDTLYMLIGYVDHKSSHPTENLCIEMNRNQATYIDTNRPVYPVSPEKMVIKILK